MQPPTYKQPLLPLRTHIEQLRKASRTGVPLREGNHTNKIREQLKTWFATMTPEQIKRRFTLEEVERLAGLVGKYGGRVAHHQIASALRVFGFESKRDWTVAGRNRRYWKYSGEIK